MKRSEFTSKLFAYCLAIGISIGFFMCLIIVAAAPQGLTEAESEQYRTIASEYYKTGEEDSDDSIKVTSFSQHQVIVFNTDEPLTPSMIYNFEKDNIKERQGVNLSVIKVFPIILIISSVIMLVIALFIWLCHLLIS